MRDAGAGSTSSIRDFNRRRMRDAVHFTGDTLDDGACMHACGGAGTWVAGKAVDKQGAVGGARHVRALPRT